MTFKYGIDKLTLSKIIAITQGKIRAELTTQTIQIINKCRSKVEKMANGSKAVYWRKYWLWTFV